MGRSWPERLRGDRIAMDRFEIRPLSPATVNDFRTRLLQPPEGWCWCVAWEVPTWEGWAERSAAPNRSLREQLWAQGEFHGYFLYCDDDAIGWCRVGPTATWTKWCATRGIEPRTDLYAFTCFELRAEYRRQGLLHPFIDRVVQDLAARDAPEVVAFPKALEGEVSDGKLWNGPVSVFCQGGFSNHRKGSDYYETRRSLTGGARGSAGHGG